MLHKVWQHQSPPCGTQSGNTETDNNIESKKSHSYDIDKQCSKQILSVTNAGTTSLPNNRFKKQQQKIEN